MPILSYLSLCYHIIYIIISIIMPILSYLYISLYIFYHDEVLTDEKDLHGTGAGVGAGLEPS